MAVPSPNTEEMAAGSRPIERKAFDDIYAAELTYVYGFLHRLGVRGRDLEDLAHDVFVTAFRKLDTFDRSRAVRPWLFGIAYRVASDQRRRKATTHEVLGMEQDAPEERNLAEEALAERDRRALLDEALQALPESRRAAFVMYELEGIPVAEISESLGIPAPTTYSRLRVAREEFAAAVQRIQLRRGEA